MPPKTEQRQDMAEIDQRGAFYLGRPYDLSAGKAESRPLLYDSGDLTTHAVCVGMTGSGKTGLCLALLEEAALQGVSAIAIDPKGDLGNLLLAFPELRPGDFRPWIDESVAARDGVTPDELASRTAELWRSGLAQWDQDGERIRRFQQAVDCAIYTPGSTAGLPLTILQSFHAPPPEVRGDADAMSDCVQSAASGLLGLVGVSADPVNSREYILVAKVLADHWHSGRDLTLPTLIQQLQQPPFDMVGAVPLDNFLSPRDRTALAMRLNNLLASPSFAAWMQGEPLDVQRLLYTADGQPRLSILSIAHLSEQERMFFVTLLLNEVLSWIRSQRGTSSLRAILYMDEVFGYFPPTANPPSKRPMLTLLKQARAYGLGCVLATQNPVDLDYKGLSNAGTWLLGRLQTERDKARVLEGLEGASAEAGARFDRAAMDRTLSALGKRVFLLNNVHDAAPQVFQSRWALSYLAGPLTRSQIGQLMAPRKAGAGPPPPIAPSAAGPQAADRAGVAAEPTSAAARPLLASDVVQRFWPVDAAADMGPVTYRPALLGHGVAYFPGPDGKLQPRPVAALQPVGDELPQPAWHECQVIHAPVVAHLERQPRDGAGFVPALPAELGQKRIYQRLVRELEDWLYRNDPLVHWTCREIDARSETDETEADFRRRIAPAVQQTRLARTRERFESDRARLTAAIAKSEQGVAENRWWFLSLMMNVATRLAEITAMAWLGRRSRKQVMTNTLWNQAMRQRQRARAAKAELKKQRRELADLEPKETDELRRLEAPVDPASVELDQVVVAPRKSDVDVSDVLLAWLPWRTTTSGAAAPAYEFGPLTRPVSE
ncbi:MAG TPA: ATP-binding protein [Lacipirellulaceae bacterium]|nr:ATP-binding protein [Lacipirellulaceae bacterium]